MTSEGWPVRAPIRIAAWCAIWAVMFFVGLCAAYLVVSRLMTRPGGDFGQFHGGPGPVGGLLMTAFAFFTARFVADRVVPLRRRRPAADKEDVP